MNIFLILEKIQLGHLFTITIKDKSFSMIKHMIF